MRTPNIIFVVLVLFPLLIFGDNDSLTDLIKNIPDSEKGNAVLNYAENYFPSDIPEYIDLLEFALSITPADSHKNLGRVFSNLSKAYYRTADYDSALYYTQNAFEQYQNINDTSKISISYRKIGDIYQRLGDLDNAKLNFEKSVEMANCINDSMQIASSINSLGLYYADTDDLETASNYMIRSLRIAEAINNIDLQSDLLNNISIVFAKLGNFSKTISYQKKAIELTVRNELSEDLAYSLNNMGIIYRIKGNSDSSLFYFQQSLKIKIELNDIKGIATTFVNIGSVYLQETKYDKALEYFFKALKIVSNNKLDREQAASLYQIGKVYYLSNNYTLAIKYLKDAIRKCDDDKYKSTQQGSYDYLARCYEKIGKYKLAHENYKKYVNIFEELNNEKAEQHILNLEAKYENTKKEKHIETLKNEKALQVVELENQKLYFFALIITFVLIITIGISLFYRYRLLKTNKEIRLKEEKNEIENKLLYSQINPHFIYNSLNTIQSFISSNNKLAAMNYIAKFGILTRNILENSRRTYIPLTEEIETVSTYIEIENLKRITKFNFELIIDENIDTESVLVPAMLAQPFIENSIKHGFKEDSADYKLIINISQTDEYIIWRITDNGIGINHSHGKSLSNKGKRRSLGMQITDERLISFGKQDNSSYFYTITDLQSEQSGITGTRVILKAPFKEL